MSLCRELMITDVPHVLSSATIETVSHTMRYYASKVVSIVSDAEPKKVLGLITEKDLIYKIMAEGRNPKIVYSIEFASNDLLKFKESDSAEEAWHHMQNRKIEWAPIVDDQGDLLGILHADDLEL